MDNNSSKVPIVFHDVLNQTFEIAFVSSETLTKPVFNMIDVKHDRLVHRVPIPPRTTEKPNLFVMHEDGQNLHIEAVSETFLLCIKAKIFTCELLERHLTRGTKPMHIRKT